MTLIYLQATILFATTLLSGLFVFLFPKKIATHSQLFLTFGGSFLFSLTLVDILPTLYAFTGTYPSLVYYLLIGFFFQFFLDLLSHGIAHGHGHIEKTHAHHPINCLGLLSALFIHAMFDGILVSGAEHLIIPQGAHHHHSHSLLSGVLLHKIPATFSFVAILIQHQYKRQTIAFYLLLFALASPLGCLLATFLEENNTLIQQPLVFCWALAVGNLLHIATTVLSEANPNHHFSGATFTANLAGALLAVMAVLH